MRISHCVAVASLVGLFACASSAPAPGSTSGSGSSATAASTTTAGASTIAGGSTNASTAGSTSSGAAGTTSGGAGGTTSGASGASTSTSSGASTGTTATTGNNSTSGTSSTGSTCTNPCQSTADCPAVSGSTVTCESNGMCLYTSATNGGEVCPPAGSSGSTGSACPNPCQSAADCPTQQGQTSVTCASNGMCVYTFTNGGGSLCPPSGSSGSTGSSCPNPCQSAADCPTQQGQTSVTCASNGMCVYTFTNGGGSLCPPSGSSGSTGSSCPNPCHANSDCPAISGSTATCEPNGMCLYTSSSTGGEQCP